ncbi:hypothetical protein, partial [Acinetobacter baumannii]|uniref:hypothetical protein n=1 Tax=Acinetobacter baumannii TaxID=470 RepID=UPI002742606F
NNIGLFYLKNNFEKQQFINFLFYIYHYEAEYFELTQLYSTRTMIVVASRDPLDHLQEPFLNFLG